MSSCPTCGNQTWLCQRCKMEQLEQYYGTPVDRSPDCWVLQDGLWHATTAFDGHIHECLCGDTVETPLDRVTDDLRYVPDEHDASVCRDCVVELEGPRRETVPDDAAFEHASEVVTDGGYHETELLNRAVREAATLIDAGDSEHVAVSYVVDVYDLEHRREDIRERLGREVVADGGVDSAVIRETASDLTKFQTRILAILAMGDDYGLAIKDELERYYGTKINHGRLYPNLDELVEQGLVDKSELDKRTNEYALTERGHHIVQFECAWFEDKLSGDDQA